MSDEQNVRIETKEEHKCFCQSKGFRKFIVIALGTFVGVYSALCLFTAIHKPPMMPPQFGITPSCPCMRHMMHKHHHHFDKGDNFEKKDYKGFEREQDQPAPFQAER